jgi:hypothetical protein
MNDQTDRQLFFSSTQIIVGDGRNTPIWKSRCIDGVAPKDIAPNIFQKVRFKRRSVHTELQNMNWARNISDLDTTVLVAEFVMLFMSLEPVQLNQEKDVIKWRWTNAGIFSVFSAYNCQFKGSISQFPATPAFSAYNCQFKGSISLFLATPVWKARVEPMCKFFNLLALHAKILTADNMLKRHWNCNQFCSLCHCMLETTNHLMMGCNFSEVVWNLVATRFNLPRYSQLPVSKGFRACLSALLRT